MDFLYLDIPKREMEISNLGEFFLVIHYVLWSFHGLKDFPSCFKSVTYRRNDLLTEFILVNLMMFMEFLDSDTRENEKGVF